MRDDKNTDCVWRYGTSHRYQPQSNELNLTERASYLRRRIFGKLENPIASRIQELYLNVVVVMPLMSTLAYSINSRAFRKVGVIPCRPTSIKPM